MNIRLKCSVCGDTGAVLFAELYDLWKNNYDKLNTENKINIQPVIRIHCHCGNKDTYNSPMFNYVFKLVFTESIVSQEIQ